MPRGSALRRIALLLCAVGHGAAAEPFIPADDAAVLATLSRAQGVGSEQIRQLRRSLQHSPTDAAAAARLAQLYTDLNSSSGEPRYLGYAIAVLMPWEQVAEPPSALWLIRARIAQRLHRFEEAHTDLAALLSRDPANREAALLLSTVAIVRGHYSAATAACDHLAAQRQQALAVVCNANLSPYVGQSDLAARKLDALIDSNTLSSELETWVLTLAAELAVGRGAAADADRYFQAAVRAMRADAPDLYLLGSYADFLSDQGRGEAAFRVLESAPATDAILIRRAVATGDADLRRRLTEQLRSRMAVLVRRDDDAHARELAWAHLSVFHEAPAALDYARRNWQRQHEMRDARLLLETALAAKDAEAARPVIEWLESNRIRHAWLDPLVDRWRQATAQ